MARCLELARKAQGRTSPNPMVGAVVVNEQGEVVGEGYHTRAGQPHAEVEALNIAGEAARGGTIYVSLEPCCHFGKTPPCSNRVIESGVKRLVCAMVDPNPRVAGGGIEQLRQAGVEVTSGVLAKQAQYLNRAFIKWIKTKRPWVQLKMAVTLDGKIADRYLHSKWITGSEARFYVHKLRDQVDCVIIGSGTAVADDAQLTVRDIPGGRDPLRVVIDRDLELAPDAKLATNLDSKTWIFASEEAIGCDAAKYNHACVKLIATPVREGRLDLDFVLEHLGANSILDLLCEGGSRLASAILPHVDELHWMLAPKLLNDDQALSVFNGGGERRIETLTPLRLHRMERLGDDVLLNYLA